MVGFFSTVNHKNGRFFGTIFRFRFFSTPTNDRRRLSQECIIPKHMIGFQMVKQGEIISFLSFADDVMIFTQAAVKVCRHVKRLIDEYCDISGQKVNFYKSIFQTTKGTNAMTRRLIQQ